MEAYLTLDGHIKAIESVTDFTYKWCLNTGMDEDEASRFALAVDELLTDMILFAYRDSIGKIEISFKYSIPQVEIVIRESGEPFDPDRYHYSRKEALMHGNFKGAGLELVRRLTDHFLFLNRGKQGKEFRLAKQLSEQNISAFSWKDEAVADKQEEIEHTYRLTSVQSEDAEDIAKLIYRSYDYSYSKEGLYYPRLNKLAIEQGHKFGTIVRTQKDRPVGYFTVIKLPDTKLGEVGEAVVSPPHRRKGIMTKMLNELIKMSMERGLLGLYGMALTVHAISQKVNQYFGFKSTALIIAEAASSRYKGFVEHYPQPVSLVADFLPLTGNWSPSVYLPSMYRSMLTDLYRQFGVEPTLKNNSRNNYSKKGETDMDLKFTYRNNIAQINVKNLGNSFITSMQSMLRSLNEVNLNAVFIDIPLDKPGTDRAVEWLHKKGFIFSGLLPFMHNETDCLRMQKIMVPIDFDLINTFSDTATELKEFIFKEYHEIQKDQKPVDRPADW